MKPLRLVFFDLPTARIALLPFAYTRPVALFRVGALTIAEKWERRLGLTAEFWCEDALAQKYPLSPIRNASDTLYISGGLLPDETLVRQIADLPPESALLGADGAPIACRSSATVESVGALVEHVAALPSEIASARQIRARQDIFLQNRQEIIHDFDLLAAAGTSQKNADPYTRVYGADNLFVEEGAVVKAATIDAEDGPVYIGKGATVHLNAAIRGAFALCEGAHVNIGAKIKGDSTVGPYCKVGGEVSNSVFFGYSNKGHDGFVGNSVIGEWCNLGADTNCSNLKNNYGTIKAYDYATRAMQDTGLQFLGLMMGDHAKCGINTMFNTGTVVGAMANVFGGGFPPKFVPSFAWGMADQSDGASRSAGQFEVFEEKKAFEMAERMTSRRSVPFTQADRDILSAAFADEAQRHPHLYSVKAN